jgi:hypothetical protein
MALDFEQQRTLGLMAGTLAQWIRDNPDALEPDEDGLSNADEYGMFSLAMGFLRMYRELLELGVIKVPTQPTGENNEH